MLPGHRHAKEPPPQPVRRSRAPRGAAPHPAEAPSLVLLLRPRRVLAADDHL